MSSSHQVVVLAAGESQRFWPLNAAQTKIETVVMGKPVIGWTLLSLAKAGLKKIIVVVSPNFSLTEADLQPFTSTFESFQLVVQTEKPGQAGALLAARPWLEPEFLVINGTLVTADQCLAQLGKASGSIKIGCRPTTQPELYGVVTLSADKKYVESIQEKPLLAGTPALRLVGVYQLTTQVTDALAQQTNWNDSTLEETLNALCAEQLIQAVELSAETPTLKYPWHLLQFKDFLWRLTQPSVHPTAKIAETALMRGPVIIEAGAVVADFAIIEGPVYIGEKALVGQHCIARKSTVLEEKAELQRFTDVTNSVIMAGTHIHSGFVGDSVLGKDCRIGAGFTTANRRLDRAEIVTHTQTKKVNTQLTRLGVMMGDGVSVGIQVGTMPNVMIAAHVKIPAGTIVTKNIQHAESS
jgi:NDP-sugar pyrophosphorylase family protein